MILLKQANSVVSEKKCFRNLKKHFFNGVLVFESVKISKTQFSNIKKYVTITKAVIN